MPLFSLRKSCATHFSSIHVQINFTVCAFYLTLQLANDICASFVAVAEVEMSDIKSSWRHFYNCNKSNFIAHGGRCGHSHSKNLLEVKTETFVLKEDCFEMSCEIAPLKVIFKKNKMYK